MKFKITIFIIKKLYIESIMIVVVIVLYIQKETTNPYCYIGCEDYYSLEEEYIYNN